jgi:hypothetical protein
MKENEVMHQKRRGFLKAAGSATAAFALGGLPFGALR